MTDHIYYLRTTNGGTMRILTWAGDNASEDVCPYCENQIGFGDSYVLYPVAPADAENLLKMRDGRPYTAIAALMHAACVSALEGGGTVTL
jgi:hypothetical protein